MSPTGYLPPIATISAHPPQTIHQAVHYLAILYTPPVRASRRRSPTPLPPNNADDLLRADPFERAYALRWLTACITQLHDHHPPLPAHEPLIQQAAALLALCAGTAAAGPLSRVFTFPSPHTPAPIQIYLTDVPLDNNDYRSLGAQTWGAACLLAESIVSQPADFGLADPHPRPEFRVLELGAGTGLVSIALGKLLQVLPGWPSTCAPTIVATDFHPPVLANLQSNIAANFPAPPSPVPAAPSVAIGARFLDWADPSAAGPTPQVPLAGPFDLVLGADIVYEAQHARWIKHCLLALLRPPSPSPRAPSSTPPLFHLLIPLRPTHAAESRSLEHVFPRADAVRRQVGHPPELAIVAEEVLVCDADWGADGDEGVKYVYYKIGWC